MIVSFLFLHFYFYCSFSKISLGLGKPEKKEAKHAGSVNNGPGTGYSEQELGLFQPGNMAGDTDRELYLYFQTL